MTELERKNVVKGLFENKKFENVFVNLYTRWMDEKEYEDIKDYEKVLTPYVEGIGGEVIKMTKRPFGIQFKLEGVKYHFFLTLKQYGYKVIK
jgi:hypothetical protein